MPLIAGGCIKITIRPPSRADTFVSWMGKARQSGALLRSLFDHDHAAAGESVQVQDCDGVDLGTKRLPVCPNAVFYKTDRCAIKWIEADQHIPNPLPPVRQEDALHRNS